MRTQMDLPVMTTWWIWINMDSRVIMQLFSRKNRQAGSDGSDKGSDDNDDDNGRDYPDGNSTTKGCV